jgi:hypothetical protein
MKRQLTAAAVLFVILAVILIGAATPRGGNVAPVYYVIASDAPVTFKRRLRHTWVCDGKQDDVQFQAAIDAAEAAGAPAGEDTGWFGPTVVLSPGEYDITTTIDVGYDGGGNPNSNAGVTIRAEGRGAWLKWNGGTTAAAWIMRYCPGDAENANHPTLKNLIFHGDDKASGLYVHSEAYRAEMSELTFHKCKGFTLYEARAHGGTFRNLYVSHSDGGGSMVFLQPNGTLVESLQFRGCESTTMPGHRRYKYTGIAGGPFQLMEYVETAASAEVGLVLYQDSDELWVQMEYVDVDDPFDDTDTITGLTSGATATIDDDAGETLDLAAGFLFYGENTFRSGPTLQHAMIQGNEFADQDGTPDNPMILIRDCGRATIDNLYTEATVARSSKQANTFIEAHNCYGANFRNIILANSPNTMTYDGARLTTDTITTSDGFEDTLSDDDYIYCWDGVGGIVDGEYQVLLTGADDTTFTIYTGHGAGDDADFFVSSRTASSANATERNVSATGIDLYNCDFAIIDTLTCYGMRTSFVTLDSACEDVAIRNLRNAMGVSGTVGSQANWMALPSPTSIVADSGTRTQITGSHIIDPSGLDYTGAPNSIQEFEESAGITHKTTLVFHDLQMSITDVPGQAAWGSVTIYTFPAGHILLTGVVVDANVDASDQYDTGTTISDVGSGDFGLGSTATINNAIGGTDSDMVASTPFGPLSDSGQTGALHGDPVAAALHDGTSTAVRVRINLLIDDGDITGDSTIAFQGTVTIYWVELGDY